MAEAARVIEEQGFDIVDLNFECPIRRLMGRGEGGALLADPAAIGRIVAAVVRAVSIPVTLKIRSGPDAEHETAAEVAQPAEAAGAAAVDVHARSVAQAYVGGPDWSVVARVKQAVTIPVLGSGGIREAADALRFLRRPGPMPWPSAAAAWAIRGFSGRPGAGPGRGRRAAAEPCGARPGAAAAGGRRVSPVWNAGRPAPAGAHQLLLRQVPAGLPGVPRRGASGTRSEGFSASDEGALRLRGAWFKGLRPVTLEIMEDYP